MTAARYLLDTDVLSVLVHDPHGRVADRIRAVGDDAVCSSIIVASEMRYGARKRGSSRLTGQVHAILSALELLPFEAPADDHYARVRHELERAGMVIGPNDMLIAAQALSHGLTLVTANEREFSHVAGLVIDNWLQ